MSCRRPNAFTLVEIMIVVAVIALLAAIAVPAFLRARQRTQNTRFINNLRIARDAFELYATEHRSYPADELRGVLPASMTTYFSSKFSFSAVTPIGGNWDWDVNEYGFTAGVSVIDPTVDTTQLTAIDSQIDDGNLLTGAWRLTASGRYTAILE